MTNNNLNIYRNARETEITYTSSDKLMEINLTVWHVDELSNWVFAYGAVWYLGGDEPTRMYDTLTDSTRVYSEYRAFARGLRELRKQSINDDNDAHELIEQLRVELRKVLR